MELPSLGELNLSHNKLTSIPDVPEWSACLTVLDLSFNQLNSLPINVVAPIIRSLNLSHNNFRTVPLCICSFVTLHSLNLGDNPDILTLPAEMGRLSMLNRLYLTNLKDLNDPPRNLQRDPRDCIRYLNSKLRCAKGFFRMKLMLVGLQNRGKTTLVKRLQGKECGNESTVGVDVSEWWFKPSLGKKPFHFSIWDFGGQQEYYATHQCFLSRRSLYLLLFNLNDGDEGVRELKPWLNNIALRAPRSCVIIIGTHLDEVPDEKREQIDQLLNRVGALAETYNQKLSVVEVMPVGLKNRIENIGLLKEAIYNHAANYKTRAGQLIMGQKIPASYHALDKQLEVVQQEVRQGLREPIMHAEEFNTMVQQMNLADIQDEEELKTATLFLTDVGSLLHYDDRSHNLHELYFVEPRWLCDMMSKVVTIKERNPFVKKGILYSKDIPMLFRDEIFPWKYFEQYLTLLDRFEIALPLDNRRVLIPSMLPEERPKDLKMEGSNRESSSPVYSRYIMFNSADTPPGFWNRLLSRIMHSIPQVCFALDKTTPSTLVERSPEHVSKEEKMEFSYTMQAPAAAPTSLPSMPSPELGDPETLFSQSASYASGFTAAPEEESADPDPVIPEIDDLEASALLPPPPEISKPMKLDSHDVPQLFNPPQLLPNFPSSLPIAMQESYDIKDIQLEYWRHGLYYNDPDVMFRIESYAKSPNVRWEKREGILIVTSPNNQGKKVIGQLVDLVISLINEWYPGLAEGQHGSASLEQRVPCFECIKINRAKPFEFTVEQCMPLIAKSHTTIECGFHRDEPKKNHTVSLADIVPDLLLQDIDPNFLLNAEDICYQEDETSLLGKGGYGKVYRGKCLNKSVAIKKYITRNEDAFTELRSEAKLLQQSHHPCLICLVGVCVYPIMALVLEEAPLKSLEFPILKKKVPVHRLTIFRIAAEVSAALRFLHGQGIIFRDLKAANVLLWTLDPASLCHCKVTDFGIATHMAPVGARGLQGTKGFIAPEVLHIGKRKQRSVYDHKADIFSFGMFLYQMIARRHPYHDIPPHRIDVSVEAGERPRLQDVDVSFSGYHYLTMLMRKCWEDNPKNRPSTEDIIKTVCLAPMQSVMCVFPVRSKFSLRRAIALTPANFIEAGAHTKLQNELWVCCDGHEGAELNIYNSHTMVKANKNFIKDNQVQCMALCNDHVWVGSRAGIEYGVIDIFNIANRDLVHNIRMRENSVSCLTAAKDRVLIGTLEGYCFSFSNDVAKVRSNAKPRYKYVSEHAVDGIACTSEFIWVSHTRYIYFLNPDNLALEGSISRDKERDAFIGQLSASPAEDVIWSAHLGGIILTAWDAHQRIHSFDVDTCKMLLKITDQVSIHDAVITAMVPALDTVWVGMATGHIMVFHNEDLVTWFQPYKEYVRFLTLISGSGPCEKEKCMVVSGGKGFQPLVANMGPDYEKLDDNEQAVDKAGVLVIFEAFEAKTLRQVKLVEESSPEFLDTHNSVRMMIHNGEFKDGTHISKVTQNEGPEKGAALQDSTPYTPDLDAQPNLDYLSTSMPDYTMGGSNPSAPTGVTGSNASLMVTGTTPSYHTMDSLRAHSKNFFTDTQKSTSLDKVEEVDEEKKSTGSQLSRDRTLTITATTPFAHQREMFEIFLPIPPGPDGPESAQVVCVACPKPPQLKVLLSELQVNASLTEAECRLEYERSPGDVARVNSQKQLEAYMSLPNRPKLFISRPTVAR
jgi:serine/threonine protein kinase/GTPase SAR1 family protein